MGTGMAAGRVSVSTTSSWLLLVVRVCDLENDGVIEISGYLLPRYSCQVPLNATSAFVTGEVTQSPSSGLNENVPEK